MQKAPIEKNKKKPELKQKDLVPYYVALFFLLIAIVLHIYAHQEFVSGITAQYLSLHLVLELLIALISFAIATVGLSTYRNAKGFDILILSLASFSIGALDLGHTLSFPGMPEFMGPSGFNKAISFWLASRTIGSCAFLYVAVSNRLQRRETSFPWLLAFLAVGWTLSSFYVICIHPSWLPNFFIRGQGLTTVKIVWEWTTALISVFAAGLLFWRADLSRNINASWLACACFLYGLCGYFFTSYQDFDDFYNFCGHCYKIVAALLLYQAVFKECVSRPYERARALAIEASEANLSKSRFLANVSHELRTPLGVIVGFSDLMLGTNKLDLQHAVWAETIERNARQLNLLIDDLLDLAKAEHEKIELRPTRFDLRILIEQIRAGFQLQGLQKNITFRSVYSAHDSFIVGTDELRLRQILMNLVGNAVKFTQAGEILIRVDLSTGRMPSISIRDSGIGMSPAQVDKLFQPFSQVSDPFGRKFAGTGLGLVLSRKLAELLGGNVELTSSVPGQGSEFKVSFLNQTNLVALPEDKARTLAPCVPRLDGYSLLIVEDSIDNQTLLKTYLLRTGLNLSIARNGAEACELAKTKLFDIILMDIQMPIMDGFEATRRLRESGWKRPIIALTAHALQAEQERAMANGFDQYLVKPISKEVLWGAVSEKIIN